MLELLIVISLLLLYGYGLITVATFLGPINVTIIIVIALVVNYLRKG